MSGLAGPFLRAMENTLRFWLLPPIAMFGWRKIFERANFETTPEPQQGSVLRGNEYDAKTRQNVTS